MHSILSRIPRWFLIGGVIGFLAALETTFAGATSISTNMGDSSNGFIANGTNALNSGYVIPGTGALTGTALGVGGVQYAVDAQKPRIIQGCVGAMTGGAVGTIGCAAAPGAVVGIANKVSGALVAHPAFLHALTHLTHHIR